MYSYLCCGEYLEMSGTNNTDILSVVIVNVCFS